MPGYASTMDPVAPAPSYVEAHASPSARADVDTPLKGASVLGATPIWVVCDFHLGLGLGAEAFVGTKGIPIGLHGMVIGGLANGWRVGLAVPPGTALGWSLAPFLDATSGPTSLMFGGPPEAVAAPWPTAIEAVTGGVRLQWRAEEGWWAFTPSFWMPLREADREITLPASIFNSVLGFNPPAVERGWLIGPGTEFSLRSSLPFIQLRLRL